MNKAPAEECQAAGHMAFPQETERDDFGYLDLSPLNCARMATHSGKRSTERLSCSLQTTQPSCDQERLLYSDRSQNTMSLLIMQCQLTVREHDLRQSKQVTAPRESGPAALPGE